MAGKGVRRTAFALVAVIIGMIGLTAASVPLYRLFCQITGYGGTPDIAEAPPEDTREVLVEVTFNADVDRRLPWRFRPLQERITVRVGEPALAVFEAVNVGDRTVVGQATYNVTPFKIGGYFYKVQCFCFNEQKLAPGERVEMPVSFFVDPEMLEDPTTDEVRQITLSYTFFLNEEATAALAAEAAGARVGDS